MRREVCYLLRLDKVAWTISPTIVVVPEVLALVQDQEGKACVVDVARILRTSGSDDSLAVCVNRWDSWDMCSAAVGP